MNPAGDMKEMTYLGTTVVTTEYNDIKGRHDIAETRKTQLESTQLVPRTGSYLIRWDAGESRPRQLRDRRLLPTQSVATFRVHDE